MQYDPGNMHYGQNQSYQNLLLQQRQQQHQQQRRAANYASGYGLGSALPQQHNDYASSGMNPYTPVPYTGPVGAPVEANIVSVPSNYTYVVDNNRWRRNTYA